MGIDFNPHGQHYHCMNILNKTVQTKWLWIVEGGGWFLELSSDGLGCVVGGGWRCLGEGVVERSSLGVVWGGVGCKFTSVSRFLCTLEGNLNKTSFY